MAAANAKVAKEKDGIDISSDPLAQQVADELSKMGGKQQTVSAYADKIQLQKGDSGFRVTIAGKTTTAPLSTFTSKPLGK